MTAKTTIAVSLAAALVAGCATPPALQPTEGHIRAESAPVAVAEKIPQPIQQSSVLAKPKPSPKAETYSVVVKDVPAQELLFALARDAKLNVDIHSGIRGAVTLNAIDQTLPQLLARISKQIDMRYELDGPNLAVMPDTPFLRTYKVDYVNLSRDMVGNISVASQVASTSSSSGQSTGVGQSGAGTNSSMSIMIAGKNHFWETLEKNLKDILKETDKILPAGSEERTIDSSAQSASKVTAAPSTTNPAGTGNLGVGAVGQNVGGLSRDAQTTTIMKVSTFREAASVIVNAEAGVVSVRATSRQHDYVQEYISNILNSLRRQVMIEATIAEVSLSENYQQGIDWSRLRLPGSAGFQIIQTGTAVVGNIIQLGYANPNSRVGNISSAARLLEGFGNVKILSSPKLSVLNNQTAVLKVVDNLVYFTIKADTQTNANVATTTYTTTLNSVPVGLVVNVTPQISESDSIILNIRPSISRRFDWAEDPNPALKPLGITNRIPVIRTREMESLLRVENGNIAVMGGLMEDSIENNDVGVPGAASLPVIGRLFQNRDDTRRKSELVIFLRPLIVRDPSITGDFSSFRSKLPGTDFFGNNPSPDQPTPPEKGAMQ